MSVRKYGRKRVRCNGKVWGNTQVFEYRSPSITLDCEKLTDEELKKLSGEVKTYNIKDLKDKNKN
ncbi:hypothetical protein MOD25_05595 [Bacillus haynesii]|uniref:hypothetical protein n=1 Tax=Bacillus haynesii TaxID=1925021 RepID=UPI00227F102B|nr:hypothetical protein [Bacillus haynesii]MCY8549375.1 hypothetical protein [Bacillus haynesii]